VAPKAAYEHWRNILERGKRIRYQPKTKEIEDDNEYLVSIVGVRCYS